MLVQSGFHLPVGAVGWPVVFGEGPKLERVKGIFSGADILHSVFSSAPLAAHAVERLREDLRRHAVLVLQDQALLQRHRHRRSVFGALAAGETDAVQSAANLSGLP